MRTKEFLEKRISKNREEINNILHTDMPLELVYIRVRMLAAQNKQLINEIEELNDKSNLSR